MVEPIAIPKNPQERLSTPLDKLWYFAQIERGIEVSSLDQEPLVGSATVLNRIRQEAGPYDSKKEWLDLQHEAASLQIDNEEIGTLKEISVEINVGDVQ